MHSTYSDIVCEHCEGITLFSSPGYDDVWDLLQLYRNRLTRSELSRRCLLFHSPKLQTHRKGQDEHIYIQMNIEDIMQYIDVDADLFIV